MLLPSWLRKYYRTSNYVERLNKELKFRSKVIGVFPNEDSLLRLMGTVLMELREALSVGRAIFSPGSLAAFMKSGVPAKLAAIAGEQCHPPVLRGTKRLKPSLALILSEGIYT